MKLKIYLQEAYDELVHKVTWPTWKELQSSALPCLIQRSLWGTNSAVKKSRTASRKILSSSFIQGDSL